MLWGPAAEQTCSCVCPAREGTANRRLLLVLRAFHKGSHGTLPAGGLVEERKWGLGETDTLKPESQAQESLLWAPSLSLL